MNSRGLWIILWITLGLAQAQLLSYFVHNAGFAIGYTNDYVQRGNLTSLPRAKELVFEPVTEAGQIVVQLISSRYETEALKLCRKGGYSCQATAEVPQPSSGQLRLEFDRKKGDTSQLWVAYTVQVNKTWLLIYLEGSSRVGLLEHFWRNSRFEAR